jgi:hypothetical protein
MRLALVISLFIAMTASADAKGGGRGWGGGSHAVSGRITSKGTYVAPHRATNPNGTKIDNWSTKGNVNPYTGQPGTKNP